VLSASLIEKQGPVVRVGTKLARLEFVRRREPERPHYSGLSLRPPVPAEAVYLGDQTHFCPDEAVLEQKPNIDVSNKRDVK
jgi:hypothetical protein